MVKTAAEAAARIAAPVVALSLLFVLYSSCDPEPSSAGSAVDDVTRILEAEQNISYQGMKEMVFGSGDHRRTHHYLVTRFPGGPTTLEAAGLPAGRVRKWTSRRSRLYWLEDRQRLLDNYRVMDIGREEIVGRTGRVLEIRSVHEGRPSVRAVVDEKTGLLLSVLFRDYLGDPGLESRFTTLLLKPELPDPPPDDGKKRRDWKPGELSELEFVPFEPRFLPEGFAEKSTRVMCRKRKMLSKVYSDGLTWFTIDQRPTRREVEERVVHQCRRGAWVRMWMVLDGVEITLKGKLDPDELVEVLKSLGGAGT